MASSELELSLCLLRRLQDQPAWDEMICGSAAHNKLTCCVQALRASSFSWSCELCSWHRKQRHHPIQDSL